MLNHNEPDEEKVQEQIWHVRCTPSAPERLGSPIYTERVGGSSPSPPTKIVSRFPLFADVRPANSGLNSRSDGTLRHRGSG
jgi:hypothetical protein